MASSQWPDEAAAVLEQLRVSYQKLGPGDIGLIVGAVVVGLLLWLSWYTVQPVGGYDGTVANLRSKDVS